MLIKGRINFGLLLFKTTFCTFQKNSSQFTIGKIMKKRYSVSCAIYVTHTITCISYLMVNGLASFPFHMGKND